MLDEKKPLLYHISFNLSKNFHKEDHLEENVNLLQEIFDFSHNLLTATDRRNSRVSNFDLAAYFGWLDKPKPVTTTADNPVSVSSATNVDKGENVIKDVKENNEEETITKKEEFSNEKELHPLQTLENLIIVSIICY